MNINAGSDTVASSLRAIFYFLLKNPSTLNKLVAELQDARKDGHLTLPIVTWTEAQSLPYLCAVVKEGLRLHPALGLPMERVVPASGLQLDDENTNVLPTRNSRRRKPVDHPARQEDLRRRCGGLQP